MEEIASEKNTLCPSARAEFAGSVVFGVIGGTVEDPRVTYLQQLQPITEELIAKASPATPTEVFRMATTCITTACLHFDSQDCRLARQITEKLLAVVEELPACSIRRDCRWWQQEGKFACKRCPQVITDVYNPSELAVTIAKLAAGEKNP